MSETVHFVKRHTSKIAWGSVVTVLLALAAGWNDNRSTSQSNQDQVAKWHVERLAWQDRMEERLKALELQNAYNKGVADGVKEALTRTEKSAKN